MKKPSIYLDTTVISAYWYEGKNVLAFSQRLFTRDWGKNERFEYEIWISPVTLAELAAGRYPRQPAACAMARRIRRLPVNRAVSEFAEHLADSGIVPSTKPNDALQMAIASVHRIDYLLTWNYAHLANPQAQRRLEQLCRDAGHRAPLMATAESIPKISHGQRIRRGKDANH